MLSTPLAPVTVSTPFANVAPSVGRLIGFAAVAGATNATAAGGALASELAARSDAMSGPKFAANISRRSRHSREKWFAKRLLRALFFDDDRRDLENMAHSFHSLVVVTFGTPGI